MIAKNIAPGLERSFSFEEHGLVNSDITEKERSFAKSKIFDGEYDIKATDIDPEMIEIAKANAKRAGQEGRSGADGLAFWPACGARCADEPEPRKTAADGHAECPSQVGGCHRRGGNHAAGR